MFKNTEAEKKNISKSSKSKSCGNLAESDSKVDVAFPPRSKIQNAATDDVLDSLEGLLNTVPLSSYMKKADLISNVWKDLKDENEVSEASESSNEESPKKSVLKIPNSNYSAEQKTNLPTDRNSEDFRHSSIKFENTEDSEFNDESVV